MLLSPHVITSNEITDKNKNSLEDIHSELCEMFTVQSHCLNFLIKITDKYRRFSCKNCEYKESLSVRKNAGSYEDKRREFKKRMS